MLEYLQLLVLMHSSVKGRVGCLVNFPVQASLFSAVKCRIGDPVYCSVAHGSVDCTVQCCAVQFCAVHCLVLR